jgi:hypothetical protein
MDGVVDVRAGNGSVPHSHRYYFAEGAHRSSRRNAGLAELRPYIGLQLTSVLD